MVRKLQSFFFIRFTNVLEILKLVRMKKKTFVQKSMNLHTWYT